MDTYLRGFFAVRPQRQLRSSVVVRPLLWFGKEKKHESRGWAVCAGGVVSVDRGHGRRLGSGRHRGAFRLSTIRPTVSSGPLDYFDVELYDDEAP